MSDDKEEPFERIVVGGIALIDRVIRDCSTIISGIVLDDSEWVSNDVLIFVDTQRIPSSDRENMRQAIMNSLDTHMAGFCDEDMYKLCELSYSIFKEMAMLVEDKDEDSEFKEENITYGYLILACIVEKLTEWCSNLPSDRYRECCELPIMCVS